MDSMFKAFMNFNDFENKGFFSKEVLLDYQAISRQPWIYFNCLDDDKNSFKLHDLELGDESLFLHLAIQQHNKINFRGFSGIGPLRGYIILPENNYRLGVFIKSGKVKKLLKKNQIDKMYLDLSSFMLSTLYSINSLANENGKR